MEDPAGNWPLYQRHQKAENTICSQLASNLMASVVVRRGLTWLEFLNSLLNFRRQNVWGHIQLVDGSIESLPEDAVVQNEIVSP